MSSSMDANPFRGLMSCVRGTAPVEPVDSVQFDEASPQDYADVQGNQVDFYEMETEEVVVPESEESFVYRVNTGLAILIGYQNFYTGEPARSGARKDLMNMYEMFTQLGFEVRYCQDKTSKDLKIFLEEITSNRELMNRIDCVAVVISSHGSEEIVGKEGRQSKYPDNIKFYHHYISTSDGKMKTGEIMDLFDNRHCRELWEKPKFFFIQACSLRFKQSLESAVDTGVEIQISDSTQQRVERLDSQTFFSPAGHQVSSMDAGHYKPPSVNRDNKYFTDTSRKMPVREEEVNIVNTPCYHNCLVAMASPSETVAWSDTQKGGWLIFCLYQVVMNYIRKKQTFNILNAVTEISHMMALTMESNHAEFNLKKCVPCVTHMLVKDILIVPKDAQNR